jgi:hypothetical protein
MKIPFFDIVAKLPNATISFVMGLFRPSAWKKKLCSHWKDFHEI